MIYSAGCLPFIVKNNKVYFLLGKDRTDGRESDFGGRSEEVDRGNPKSTAVCEFYEETIGVVLDTEEVEARLNDPECHVEIKSKTMGGGTYTMFCIHIPYMSLYAPAFQKFIKFMRYTKAHRKFIEKSTIGWFSLPAVLAAAEGKQPPRECSIDPPLLLRDVFAATVRLGSETLKALPEKVSCHPPYTRHPSH
jgi:hypothetical protein